jgi:outer membrane receptor protein involved in Fe transport
MSYASISPPTLQAFISYAHNDEQCCKKLLRHLKLIENAVAWHYHLIAPQWFLGLSDKSILDRQRAASDPRPSVADYTVVNLSLQRKNIGKHVDVSLMVRNLFNADTREPSIDPTSLPDDIPLAGTGILGAIHIRFRWN